MPKSKEEIYALFSPRFATKRKKSNPRDIPLVVDNAVVTTASVGNPHKIHPTQDVVEKVISPNEGKPAVNGQAEKLDIRREPVTPTVDPGVAAIPLTEKKKPGRPKKDTKKEK